MKYYLRQLSLITAALLMCNISGIAQESDSTKSKSTSTRIGGPSSVQSQIQRDAEERVNSAIKHTDEWLKEHAGLNLGADYNITMNQISNSPNANAATGGVFRLYGHWNPLRKKPDFTGNLIFKFENRHKIGGDFAPQLLGPYAGYAGITAVTFNNLRGIVTNFYWTQSFANNRIAFNLGLVDFTDYVNLYGLINVWTEFNNLAYATEPTMVLPNQGLGGVVRFMFTPKYYIMAGMADVNGDPTRPFDIFSSFINTAQYLSHVEVGRISSWDDRYANNTHLTFWHADESNLMGTPEGWGLAFSWSQTFSRWLLFARAGYSEGAGSFLRESVSIGGGYQFKSRNDYFGIGLNWGQPPKEVVEGSTKNQYTLETYYRVQLISQVSIWPSFQLLVNPAYRPEEETLWLLGLRLRAAL